MIKKTYTFKADIEDVWLALTDPLMIFEWSKYQATMSEQAGAQFSLWEGDVHGTNIEVIPKERLVQNWFGGDWEAPSVVTFSLRKGENNSGAILELEHTGVPADEEADFERGWDEYYIGPIMELLQPYDFPREQEIFPGVGISEITHENILWDLYPDEPMPADRDPLRPKQRPAQPSTAEAPAAAPPPKPPDEPPTDAPPDLPPSPPPIPL